MESWSYVSGGKGFMTNDEMSTSHSFSRRKMTPCWSEDPKAPSSFGNGVSDSVLLPVDNQGLGLMGYQDVMSGSRVHVGKIISPFTGLEHESSSSRLSSSVVDSDRFDLQLGVFGAPVASSSGSYVPSKRMMMGVNCNVVYCQVCGCNKDLSFSKDYHKRHKVCEAHSKTAKVIVNGIEQRFCQQCSRFHLLAEFDDGKRSCRKRLAGHNQRRRKPQVGFHSGRTVRLLQAYNAGSCSGLDSGRFHGAAFSQASFVCPDILPSGLMHHEKYRSNDWSSHIKLEQGANCSHLSAGSRMLFPNSSGTGGIFADNSSRYLHDLGAPDANSRLWIAESFPAFDAGLSGITDSGCALSLLSSQSNNSTNHSSGMHTASHLSTMLIPESNGVINFDIVDGIYQGPYFVNEKDQFCCEAAGGTINLLQLSSQLQRVECEKKSNQSNRSKPSSGAFEESCSASQPHGPTSMSRL